MRSRFLSLPLLGLLFLLLVTPLVRGEEVSLNIEETRSDSLAIVTYTEDLVLWQRSLGELYQKMAAFSRQNRGEISSRHLTELRALVEEYHSRHLPRLQRFTKKEPFLLGIRDVVEITDDKTEIKDLSRFRPILEGRSDRSRGGLRFRGIKAKRYLINPNDEEGQKLWLHFKNQFSAQVILLESYIMGLSPFLETKAFRWVLLRDLTEDTTTETLEELWFESMEILFKRDRLVKALAIFQDGVEVEENKELLDTALNNIVLHSKSYQELRKRKEDFTFFREIAKNMSFMAKRRWDAYQKVGIGTLFEGSRLFGNLVGMFQSRHGYLYHWSEEKENEVAADLRPLDILMEKTPFRLTDRFIPGHFGHAAIWTGGEEELKMLGVWNELPRIYENAVKKFGYKGLPFQEAVRQKKRIIEALRPGVQFNTFRHFLEIDDLAVLRMRDCAEDERPRRSRAKDIHCLTNKLKKEYLIKAFEQVGKDYDFAFNVNTEQTIVCSELIYRSFLDIDFETTLTVGQHNISPDQVAKKADDLGDPFSPILFYHEGEKVELEGEGLRSFMKNLMNQ